MSHITLACAEKIVEQMKNNVCKIILDNAQGTGFFCLIPYPDMNNRLPVLITNNHIINEKLLNEINAEITISTQDDSNIKKLKLDNKIKYTNKEYDVTIIEVKEEDNIKSYLELDDTLLKDVLNDINMNESYLDQGIYLIGYIQGFDEFTLTLVVKKEIHLIYKHAIKYIKIYNRQDF